MGGRRVALAVLAKVDARVREGYLYALLIKPNFHSPIEFPFDAPLRTGLRFQTRADDDRRVVEPVEAVDFDGFDNIARVLRVGSQILANLPPDCWPSIAARPALDNWSAATMSTRIGFNNGGPLVLLQNNYHY